MGMGGQRHVLTAFPPAKRPGAHCTWGSEGPKTGLDGCGKILPPPGFDRLTVQTVVSRYTDWAIPAHPCSVYYVKKNCAFHDEEFGTVINFLCWYGYSVSWMVTWTLTGVLFFAL
jgi:hypothetical protein